MWWEGTSTIVSAAFSRDLASACGGKVYIIGRVAVPHRDLHEIGRAVLRKPRPVALLPSWLVDDRLFLVPLKNLAEHFFLPSHFRARVAPTTQQYGMASFAFRVLSFAAMAVAYFGFTFYQLPGPSNIGECERSLPTRR